MAAKKSGFQMVNSRWPPKSPDFKWSIQDGSQKLLLRHLWSVFECHLLTDPLSTIRNPDTSGFQIPTVPLTDIYFFWSGRKPHVTIFLNKIKRYRKYTEPFYHSFMYSLVSSPLGYSIFFQFNLIYSVLSSFTK